jgi:hypothetical protein
MHVNQEFPVKKELWEEALTRIIAFHAPFRHDSEVAWAIWTALALDLKIGPSAVQSLKSLDDPIVILQALHAEEAGLCAVALDKSEREPLMIPESLSGKHWLLAYEASSRGWLPTGGSDFVGDDPDFGFLRSHKVQFYLPDSVRNAKPSGMAPSFGLAPMFY